MPVVPVAKEKKEKVDVSKEPTIGELITWAIEHDLLEPKASGGSVKKKKYAYGGRVAKSSAEKS